MAATQSTFEGQPASPANDAQLLPLLYFEGDTLYEAMLASIAAARHSVLLESYLFASDEIGWMFARALAGRADAGLDVRLHLDAAGTVGRTSRAMLTFLGEHGIKLRFFHRWSWRQPLRYNRRNHRKLLVVDGRIAYVGGFNIHRESARAIVGESRWRDTHIAVGGALATQAAALFEISWRNRHTTVRDQSGMDGCRLLSNHNRAGRRRLRRVYADALASARERISVTTPYFVPDPAILRRLLRAARAGLRVDLLVPARSDVPIAQWAARSFYARLIKAGVRIHEYRPRMLHAKTLLVDGRWAAVGTANLDYRSLHLNYELVVVTENRPLCEQLERQFAEDIATSVRIAAPSFTRRGWMQRLLERIGYALRRWL